MFRDLDKRRIRDFVRDAGQPCVAIFDVGTRAVRVVVAPKRVADRWGDKSFCNDSVTANLGFDVGFSDFVLPLDSRSLQVATYFVRSRSDFLAHLGVTEVNVIATAWIRWVTNQAEVLDHFERATGKRVEVIQQEREAELTIAALPEIMRRTQSGRHFRPGDLAMLVDQGGGSLEVSWMEWGQRDADRPIIGKYPLHRLGTVRLRQQFFYHDKDGRETTPEKNQAKVFAQIARIQEDARTQLTRDWPDRMTLLRTAGRRHAYAVGSAITGLFNNRTPHKIHERVVTRASIEKGLQDVSRYYDKLRNPVLTIYKKMLGLEGAGVERITKTNFELDRDLTKLYGLPVYLELMEALQLDRLNILGYPLRFGYYVWKYAKNEPESSVRSDTSGPYVFVSYAREDKALVFDQLATFDAMGLRVFWDEEGVALRWGDDFEPEIAKAIRNSKGVIWCLSPESAKSRFVLKEVKFADRNGIPVFPLELMRTVLPDDLDMMFGSGGRWARYKLREDRFRELIRQRIPPECFRRATV